MIKNENMINIGIFLFGGILIAIIVILLVRKPWEKYNGNSDPPIKGVIGCNTTPGQCDDRFSSFDGKPERLGHCCSDPKPSCPYEKSWVTVDSKGNLTKCDKKYNLNCQYENAIAPKNPKDECSNQKPDGCWTCPHANKNAGPYWTDYDSGNDLACATINGEKIYSCSGGGVCNPNNPIDGSKDLLPCCWEINATNDCCDCNEMNGTYMKTPDGRSCTQ